MITNTITVPGFPGFIPPVPARSENTPPKDADDSGGVRDSGDSTNHEAPQPPTVRVAGPEDAGRSLTLDLGGLISRIKSMPDPAPEADDYTRAGVQLLSALQDGCVGFGLASPGTDLEDSVAEQIMNITDEAFEAADQFLMITEALEETEHVPQYLPEHSPGQHPIGSPTLAALLLELRSYSIRNEMRAVRNLPASTDRRLAEIGGEFF